MRAALPLLLPLVVCAAGGASRPCCAYGGSGGLTALGQGTFPWPAGARLTPFLIGASPELGSAVFVDPTLRPGEAAPTAPAGWMIIANASARGGQALWAWNSDGVCAASFQGPFGAFNACFGTPGAAFPFPAPAPISFGPGVAADLWTEASNVTTAVVLEAGCAIVSMMGGVNPSGFPGAWAFTVVDGAGAPPDPAWFQPPAQCRNAIVRG
jgi:hypothetical protein